jgi:hypothetical protein
MEINIGSQNIKTQCTNIVNNLIDKYKDDDYMLNRLATHIHKSLPNMLENVFKTHNTRVQRNEYLTTEQQLFIKIFLTTNKYFYLSSSNFFYEYDDEKFMIIKEDDVIHKLLSTISKDRVLLEWKYKTKKNILKQIKERSLFTCIPETKTIQNVLNILYPLIFSSKTAAKYFLTIIGDTILKKQNPNIYLISNKMKQLLNDLADVAVASIGANHITNNFSTKYHENNMYENYRLIKINESCSTQIWRELLKRIGLDLLCVAVHYSKRYENSDNYIDKNVEQELKNYTYYLKNTDCASIINIFCEKYIITTNETTNNKMEWKNLHFVWKQFLSNSCLINMIYSNTLKTALKDKFEYDEKTDCFLNITSKYLPIYSNFILFYESTIATVPGENSLYDFHNVFETDELLSLFKIWSLTNLQEFTSYTSYTSHTSYTMINEETIIKILKHFFPQNKIFEDKYVLNINSTMWNKIEDIKQSFSYIKEQIELNNIQDLISLDDLYNHYYKYSKTNKNKLIVSKNYFDKYIYYLFSDAIVYDKFLKIGVFN